MRIVLKRSALSGSVPFHDAHIQALLARTRSAIAETDQALVAIAQARGIIPRKTTSKIANDGGAVALNTYNFASYLHIRTQKIRLHTGTTNKRIRTIWSIWTVLTILAWTPEVQSDGT